MALVSPGVEVTIIDQSQYVPSASNSVPLIILATAQNKTNAAGTGVAAATTKANANKLYQVVNLFGWTSFKCNRVGDKGVWWRVYACA